MGVVFCKSNFDDAKYGEWLNIRSWSELQIWLPVVARKLETQDAVKFTTLNMNWSGYGLAADAWWGIHL
jgi:hypothetical protein